MQLPYVLLEYVRTYVHICATYEVNGTKNVTRSTVYVLCKLHFMLLVPIIDKIWLPHCTHKSNCPQIVWANISKIGALMCQNTTNCNSVQHHICMQ